MRSLVRWLGATAVFLGPIASLPAHTPNHRSLRGHAFCVAFSPDARTLASGGYDDVYLWEVGSGKQGRLLKGFSRDIPVSSRPWRSARMATAVIGEGEFVRRLRKSFQLHRADDQLLVLKASLGAKLFTLLPILSGAVLIYVSILKPDWSAAVAGVLFLVAGLSMWVLLVLPRFEFDARARRMRTVWLWSQPERPLEQVLAVQLIKWVRDYELNLA